MRCLAPMAIFFGVLAFAVCCAATGEVLAGEEDAPDQAPFVTKSIRGRVVWLADALSRRYGIKTVPEAADRSLALETPGGEVYPIVEDIRGRAFRRDKRLREMDVDLLVRQYEGSPVVQIVRAFEITGEGKFELDYWCEICSIAMFELKACDCCQGPIELRRRKVDASGRPAK